MPFFLCHLQLIYTRIDPVQRTVCKYLTRTDATHGCAPVPRCRTRDVEPVLIGSGYDAALVAPDFSIASISVLL